MPMLDSYLATINHSHSMLLKLVADLSDDQIVQQPAPKVNHPAWVLGHQIIVDSAFVKLITNKEPATFIDDEWKATYGQKSEPVADKSKYKPKAFYLEQLAILREQIMTGLHNMKPEDFQKPHPDPARRDRFPTIGHAVMLYGTWHEAYHAGQLSTWRRVLGLPAV
jgi:uncharacterized damage-inducible protein DinB